MKIISADMIGGDVTFSGVSIDTRSLSAGELFVAIPGPNYDGHNFLNEAKRKGASAAMVSKQIPAPLPILCVPDTRKALASLAAGWRQRFTLPLIALTGSNGKTTVKEMLAAILRQSHQVLVTQGNLNNELGVPLTLLRLSNSHEYAVIEMGANHLHEIEALTAIAQPDVALVTNVGDAHLEGFGSRDRIALGKSEIFSGLRESGVAVINRDDAYYELFAKKADVFRCISFGVHPASDIRLLPDTIESMLRDNRWITSFDVALAGEVVNIKLALAGRHNVQNALAAIAAAQAVNIPVADMVAGLASLTPVPGRMQIKPGIGEWSVIDDTYNANPGSVAAAVATLASLPGNRIFVMGDMAELGAEAAALHARIGAQSKEQGINRFYGVGALARYAVEGFGAGAKHYETQLDLINALIADLHSGCSFEANTILVKGSRSAGMERVVDALVTTPGNRVARSKMS